MYIEKGSMTINFLDLCTGNSKKEKEFFQQRSNL